jgi:hypothetical protein
MVHAAPDQSETTPVVAAQVRACAAFVFRGKLRRFLRYQKILGHQPSKLICAYRSFLGFSESTN